MSGIRLGVTVLAATLLTSCVGVEAEILRPTVKDAVTDALASMSQPENTERLHQLLEDEVLDQTAERLARAFTSGVLVTLSSGEKKQLIDELVERVVKAASAQLALGLQNDIGPALDTVVVNAVQRSLDAVLSERTEKAVERIAARGGAAMSDAIVRAVAKSLDKVASSNLGAELSAEAGAAFRQELETVKPALAAIGHDVVKEAMEGAAEELNGNLGASVRKELNQDVQDVARTGEATAERFIGFLFASILGLALLLMFIGSRLRHHRRQSGEHASALAAIAGAIRQQGDQKGVQQLIEALQDVGKQGKAGSLSQFLDDDKSA